MNRLILRYEPEDGHHGELTVKLESNGFSGQSSAWFNVIELSKFGDDLSALPTSFDTKTELIGGLWKHSKIDKNNVSIRFEQTKTRRELCVCVDLVTPSLEFGQVDQNSVRAHLLVSYSDLDRFLPFYRDMIAGKIGSATLDAPPT